MLTLFILINIYVSRIVDRSMKNSISFSGLVCMFVGIKM